MVQKPRFRMVDRRTLVQPRTIRFNFLRIGWVQLLDHCVERSQS